MLTTFSSGLAVRDELDTRTVEFELLQARGSPKNKMNTQKKKTNVQTKKKNAQIKKKFPWKTRKKFIEESTDTNDMPADVSPGFFFAA